MRVSVDASGAGASAPAEQAAVEATQQATLDALEQGVALTTIDGSVRLLNRAGERILRRTAAQMTELKLGGDWVVFDGDGTVIPLEATPVARTLATGEPLVGAVVGCRRGDGELISLRVATEPVRGPAGELTGVVWAFTDVTAEQRADREREAIENRFRAAFEHAPFGVELAVPDAVVDVNPQMAIIAGRDPKELLGHGLAPFIHPDDAARLFAEVVASEARGDELFETEVRIVRPDGSYRWVRGRIVLVEGDRGITRIVHVEDITEARAAQLALAEAEEELRRAFDDALVGMSIVDMAGRYRRVNPAMCRLIGRTAEQLVGTEVVTNLHPDDREPRLERIRKLVGGTASGFEAEQRYVRPDGSIVWARVFTALVRAPDGAPVHFVNQVEDITEAREAREALAAAEAELRWSFEQSAMPTVLIDPDGRFRRVNDAFAALVGREPNELVGTSYVDTIHPDERGVASSIGRGFLQGELSRQESERRLVRADGSTIWTRITTAAVRRTDGGLSHVVTQVADITEARAAKAAVEASHARFEALVERSTDVICVLDADGAVSYASPEGARLLGLVAGSTSSLLELVHEDDRAHLHVVLDEIATEPGAARTAEVRVRDQTGAWRHVEMVTTNRLDDPAVAGIVANVRDVTERAEAAARLAWQAFHDPLTGLPNRALLLDRLGQALSRARRAGERVALLFVDLDRFKLVNDTMGHLAGDHLLVEVAARLTQAVRREDTVARLGGDEFVVLAEALADVAEAERLAERIAGGLVAPIPLPQGSVVVTASIGIAIDNDHRPETLLREADTALYCAKENGRARYEIFDESLRLAAVRRLEIEQLLRRALDEGGLVVHYQPIVDLTSGAIVTAEALLRVRNEDGELQSPLEFVTVADESGLIVPVGAGVLDAACAALAEWQRRFGIEAPRQIAVNVTARQLGTAGFEETVLRTLERHGLGPRHLCLELTESTIIGAEQATTHTIERLHARGVALAVDDFGTGYSSLAYLKRFPIDVVKLDRSFVAGLGTDPSDTEIVRAVVSLGRSLGLIVVAEGIETAEQLDTLRRLGCDRGQGYLLARPQPEDQLSPSGAGGRGAALRVRPAAL